MPYVPSVPFRWLAVSLSLALSSTLLSPAALAQEAPVASTAQTSIAFTGSVVSNTGQPLAGASIMESGKILNQTTTNSDGYFLVAATAKKPLSLIISFPDYETQHLMIKHPESEKNLIVTLQSLGKHKSKALRARQKQFKRKGV